MTHNHSGVTTLDYTPVSEAIRAGRVDARLTLECMLLVALGLRRTAIVTVPAELPDGDVLGAQVDYEFRDRLAGRGSDLRTRFNDTIERRRQNPMAFKLFLLRSSFTNNVPPSDSYRTHREMASSIGLEISESEVRPTIREWYVCRSADRPAVTALLQRRHELQRANRQGFRTGDAVSYYIYPEERSPEHLRALGDLLGYPACCTEAYLRGRLEGEGRTPDIPEVRGARQITEAGGPDALPATAFWLKDFFPCEPLCPEATSRGREAEARLARIDPFLARRYAELRQANLARVASGPAALEAHEAWLRRH